MVSFGLGKDWSCLFANDIDKVKATAYRANHNGGAELHHQDIASLKVRNLPGHADLAWASFPCQDLSLAGAGRGLQGERSGTFWHFWRLINELNSQGRAPLSTVIVTALTVLISKTVLGGSSAAPPVTNKIGKKSNKPAVQTAAFLPLPSLLYPPCSITFSPVTDRVSTPPIETFPSTPPILLRLT